MVAAVALDEHAAGTDIVIAQRIGGDDAQREKVDRLVERPNSVPAQLFGGDAGGRRGGDGAGLRRLGDGGDDVLFEQGFEVAARILVGVRDRRHRHRRACGAHPRQMETPRLHS